MDSRRNKVSLDRRQIDDQIGYEENGGGFAKAFNDTAGSFLANAMPQFRSQLQLTREDAVRRGVGTGDLGTSNEGDLTSAFQRNIANSLASLSASGYEHSRDRILELLGGKTSMDQADAASHSNMWGSIFGTGIGALGMLFGKPGSGAAGAGAGGGGSPWGWG
jgi:hypothetical protein